MDRFEQAFGGTERAAAAMQKAARELATIAGRLQKAAREGRIRTIRTNQAKIEGALATLRQASDEAVHSWPFESREEERYLKGGYAAELKRAASERGLDIHEREDGDMICYPSILKILPGSRAVRIDSKMRSMIRPSHLADHLRENQNRKRRFAAKQFLEALYKVYKELVLVDTSDRLVEPSSGRVIRLEKIYRMFTSRPGANREYSKTDFARDIYRLETSGHLRTRSGAEVSFPASTGTRSARGVFHFIGRNGQYYQYSSIRFIEESSA